MRTALTAVGVDTRRDAKRRRALCASVSLAALLALSQPGAFAQSFAFLPFSSAFGVSADGTVVAGNQISPGNSQALRWTAAGGTQLIPASGVNGISADGLAFVGTASNGADAMRWTAATGVVLMGVSGGAFAASRDGSVVVGTGVRGPLIGAYRWTSSSGVATPLGFLPGTNSSNARGVNADGSVVVGDSTLINSGTGEAFRWTQADGMKGIGRLPGDTASVAFGITADGSTIVGSSFRIVGGRDLVSGQAFRWTQSGGMVGLGVLPGDRYSDALAVSADGAVIVGTSTLPDPSKPLPGRGFVWDYVFGMQDLRQVLQSQYGLNVPEYNFRVPTAASADGRVIVGFGEDASGTTRAFLITDFLVNRLVDTSYGVAAGKADAIGILGGSGVVTIGAGGSLTIAGNNLSSDPVQFPNSVFSGTIAGAGDFIKAGTGTWLFTGSFQSSGNAIVNAGTLLANGNSAGSGGFVVNAGGTLGGNGTVSSTTINAGGTLSPGNSIGTIAIAGNLTFVGAGNYLVEVSPTAADRTNVTGTAALSGRLSGIGTGGAGYTVGQRYTVLNAAGGVSGTFGNTVFTGSFGGLRPRVEYDANNVYVVLDPGAILPLLPNGTSNQRAVAAAQDAATAAGSQAAPFLATLNLPAAQLPGALDQLSGEVHVSTAGVLVDESRYPREAVLGRLRQASYGGNTQMASLALGGPQLAFADGEEASSALAYGKSPIVTKAPLRAPRAESDVVFWAQGFGARGRFDSDGNAATVRRDLAGFITGVDTRVGGNGRLGVAAGYTGSKNALDGRGSSDVDTAHIAGYGGWSFGSFNLRAGGAYAFHTIATDRIIAFPGFADRLTASYDGRTGQIFGELGYGFAMGNLAIEPFAGAAWVRVQTDAAAERGGPAALNFAGTTFETGYTTLGVRFAGMMSLAHEMILIPRATLAWQHAFDSVTPAGVLAFQGAPVPFTIAGVPIARDALLAEAGLDLAIGRSATIGVSYVGQIASNVQDHAAKGKFSYRF